jgi:phosphonate transport system substrate-binding protein
MLKVFLLLLSSYSAHAAQSEPLRLHFGVYPSDRATIMYRKFSPILEAITEPLQNQLKREVDIHLTIFEDYESGIQALAEGSVDFVRFGPSSYILAEQRNHNITLLAMELRNGMKTFNGVVVAKRDSGITSIEDLVGKKFAFGDEHSTIGRYLSQALLAKHGVTSKNLESFDYLPRHDLVAKAVIVGTHDAGAMKFSTYKKLCDPKEYVILASFENVTKPWVSRSELPKDIRDAITASLLILDKQEVIGDLGCSGFTQATKKDYDRVRQGMKESELFEEKEPEKEPNVLPHS